MKSSKWSKGGFTATSHIRQDEVCEASRPTSTKEKRNGRNIERQKSEEKKKNLIADLKHHKARDACTTTL